MIGPRGEVFGNNLDSREDGNQKLKNTKIRADLKIWIVWKKREIGAVDMKT